MLACAPSLFCRKNATTLATIRPTLTHWKLIERRGLSSERGMKTTGQVVLFCNRGASAQPPSTSTVLAGHPKHIGGAALIGGAAGHEQQIRQPIDVLQRGSTDVLVGRACQRHHAPLRAPANRARHVQRRGTGRATRQNEGGERRQLGIELVDFRLQAANL